MPVSYDDIKIEDAKDYYLIPLKDNGSVFYLGNSARLFAFKIVADASLVTATGGILSNDEPLKDGTKLYLFLDTDKAGVEEIMRKVEEVPVC